MRTRSALGLPVILVLLAKGGTQQLAAQVNDAAAQIRHIAGCYSTQLGSWSGPFPPPNGGGSAVHTPPEPFQLDTVVVNIGGQARLAVRPDRLGQSRIPANWAPVGTDSIVVFWSTGFVGVRLQLGMHHDSLIGHAMTFHDNHVIGEPPDPSASVIATRRACPP